MTAASLNAFADIAGNVGYAIHGRHFLKALNKLLPICIVPKHGRVPKETDDEELWGMLANLDEINLNAVSLNLDLPCTDLACFGGKKRVAYTVFETRVMPKMITQILAQMDQVWVPTAWAQGVLVENGIPQNLIRLVPEGVDGLSFLPTGQGFPNLMGMGGYRFLSVGKWEERKGMKDLLYAFDDAFTAKDEAYLVVYFQSESQELRHINIGKEIKALGLKNQDRIVVVQERLPKTEHMAFLYNSCNAYVSASKAEGWGLPLMEAMSCGLPVIAPYYSGPTEFLNEQVAYPYPVTRLEDVYCPTFFPNKGYHGQWASIDRDVLIAKMRHVYENRSEAYAKGMQAAAEVRQKWTWALAAQKAFEHLKPLL